MLVFSQAQDTKVDTFSYNVSATMCPSLAKHFHVYMQDTNFVSANMFRAWLNLATSRHTRSSFVSDTMFTMCPGLARNVLDLSIIQRTYSYTFLLFRSVLLE